VRLIRGNVGIGDSPPTTQARRSGLRALQPSALPGTPWRLCDRLQCLERSEVVPPGVTLTGGAGSNRLGLSWSVGSVAPELWCVTTRQRAVMSVSERCSARKEFRWSGNLEVVEPRGLVPFASAHGAGGALDFEGAGADVFCSVWAPMTLVTATTMSSIQLLTVRGPMVTGGSPPGLACQRNAVVAVHGKVATQVGWDCLAGRNPCTPLPY